MDSDPAENQVSNDGVKEVLAPADGPRENLINTAVKFLQNPKVMSSPLYQKRAFLEKKGLTQVEIDLAVKRAGVVETAPVPGNNPNSNQPGVSAQVGPPQVYNPMMAPPGTAQPHYVPIPPQSGWARARDLTLTTAVVASVSYAVYHLFQSGWARARDLTLTTAVIASVSYAVYHLFQTYLRPWLMGKSEQEKRFERLEEEVKAVQKSVEDSLSQISGTLAAIQTSLVEQQQQNLTSHGELRGISDLKADIASLKGLMLNKNQFPALPTPAPILPSWQRASTNTTSGASSSSSSSPSLSSLAKPTASTTAASGTMSNGKQTGEASEQAVKTLSEGSEDKLEAEKRLTQDENCGEQDQKQQAVGLSETAEKEIKTNGYDDPQALNAENTTLDSAASIES
ncbi:peroxisomal membrane protein pex14 [Plakobranchus ocellatus]|uniref:Peroxisomal membrane protein PEX14 n=1 Tax=Plakobranchus ocellatus TaxID=259542 RepID=A0AAV3XYQ2_9GAST|nr:peroxisomal membrane protein pex14 [Plakobranchus ocellatus]